MKINYGKTLGILGAYIGSLGVFMPFHLFNMGNAIIPVSYFMEFNLLWYEYLWPFVGIAIMLIGALMESRAVLAAGGIVSLSLIGYLTFLMVRYTNGNVTPYAGYVFYLIGGLLGITGAFFMNRIKIISF